MWRFFSGLSRVLRTRTPAPPSQTAPRSEDNENARSSTGTESADTTKPVAKPCKPQTLCLPQSMESENEIAHKLLEIPSEADILLREYFGPSWKNKNPGGGAGCTNEHVWDRFSLGMTMWMTVFILGRTFLSTWRTRSRNRQICYDEACRWQEFDLKQTGLQNDVDFYQNHHHLEEKRIWTSRLPILPHSARSKSVLAAGNEGSGGKTLDIDTDRKNHVGPVGSVRFSKRLIETESPSRQRSVTFDIGYDEQPKSSSTSSISEEAIENFAEGTKDFSGATYDILGLQSVRSGDYREAFLQFHLGANDGHPKALFNVGLCYENGLGTKTDIGKAINAYEKAAFKGHSKAQYNLALILLGKGSIADKIEALRLLEEASLGGLVQAQSFLGVYLTKPGEFQDFKKAVKMFKMASKQGDASSKYHLGICYERALGGLKQDLSKAFDLYSSAASSNHLDAQYQLAMMLDSGFQGKKKNPELAQELLKAAAKVGHGPSNRILKEKRDEDLKREREKAIRLRGPSNGGVSDDQSRFTVQSFPNWEKSGSKHDLKRNADEPGATVMPDILSRHIFKPNMMNDLLPPQYKSPNERFRGTRSKADLSDGMPDLLCLPRVSTTPADLCYRSTVLKDSANSITSTVATELDGHRVASNPSCRSLLR